MSIFLGKFKVRMLKSINKPLFIIATFTYAFLWILSFLAYFSESEGTLPKNLFFVFLYKLFPILNILTPDSYWRIIGNGPDILFILGIVITSIFYGFIVERLFYLFRI